MRSVSRTDVLTEDLPRLGVTALADGTVLLSAGWDQQVFSVSHRVAVTTRLPLASPASVPAALELELAGAA